MMEIYDESTSEVGRRLSASLNGTVCPKRYVSAGELHADVARHRVRWLMALGVYSLTYLAFELWLGAAEKYPVIQLTVSGMQIGVASALAWWASRRCRGESRLASSWRWIAAGLGCTAAGYAVLVGYQVLTGSAPYPSMADVMYLLCYPFFFVGVLRFPMRQDSGPERTRARLDAGTIALCGACFVWVLILAPAVAEGGPNLMTAVVSGAYPTADLLMVFGLARLLVRGAIPSCRLPLQLLAGGMLATVVGDVIWGWGAVHPGAVNGIVMHLIYLCADALFLVAAVSQRVPADHLEVGGDHVSAVVDRSRRSGWLAYLAPTSLFGLLLYAQAQASVLTRVGLTVAATAVLLLVIVRQFTVQRDLGQTLDLLTEKTGELRAAQAQLIDSARQAGMAEIATDVLHNVGNVLNSVNVSANVVCEKVQGSKSGGLAKAVALMNEHPEDLGDFLTTNARGKALPGYLNQLAATLAIERESIETEVLRLTNGVAHIKEIVAAQQSLAGISGVIEPVRVSDLFEDALRMAGIDEDEVTVARDFHTDPLLALDRHRVVMILLNLLSNAMYAMKGNAGRPRVLSIRAEVIDGQGLSITVADTGVGIPPENLTRIFVHGFTTHAEGHGFGLHSSALAAEEMGGALRVQEDAGAHGAAFTLDVPLHLELVPV